LFNVGFGESSAGDLGAFGQSFLGAFVDDPVAFVLVGLFEKTEDSLVFGVVFAALDD
jgi:hypothetical protein